MENLEEKFMESLATLNKVAEELKKQGNGFGSLDLMDSFIIESKKAEKLFKELRESKES